jgi:fatty-acid peroxygenase
MIPRDAAFDATHALLFTEGYEFISNRCRRNQTDVFATRIMLRKAVCIQGAEAAAQFYSPGRFTRRRALPLFALTLIQDLGSVMLMDGEDHRRRKEMFLTMMSPESLTQLADLTAKYWRSYVVQWQGKKRVTLFHQAHLPLCAAICEWSGLRLSEKEIRKRAHEFEAMVEGTGAIGARNWRGHLKRSRTERWMRRVIRRIRSGEIHVPNGIPAHMISTFRDRNGALLDVKSAAVELINVLRPAVANVRYVVFAAMALHVHEEWRERLAQDDEWLDAFVDEVRRFYPFIPVIGGRVLVPFEWRNHGFEKDDWVLFDIYGTNHDARIWGDPQVFRPERFKEQAFGPYDLVSHGAGDRRMTHRCPGEWITVEQMKVIIRILVREMSYEVPSQNLNIKMGRIPALPKSRFVIQRVRVQIR